MDIHEASRSYEAWLRQQTKVVAADLRLKHERMRESPFVFLRATFYRWLQHWPEVCRPVVDAPRVLAIGDLHIENFGTWRDAEGRLIWGVNDVDEACTLPYTQDLVRLASSALLAIHAGHFDVPRKAACGAILDGYIASLEEHGRPVVLAEHRRWLRLIALNRLRDPVPFWAKLTTLRGPAADAPGDVLRRALPEGARLHRITRRIAGVGSLGRPRFVAIAEWKGSLVAREAKAFVPSAYWWHTGRRPARGNDMARLLAQASRAVDPGFAVRDGWIVRRLAPDCTRVELDTLPIERDELKLLKMMGWETANLHVASARDPILRDLARRPRGWLAESASRMCDAVIRDFRDWRRNP